MSNVVRFFAINCLVVPALCLFTNFTHVGNVRTFSKPHNGIAYSAIASQQHAAQEQNHPPVVKLTAPKSNSRFEYNATVPYTITVSDKEDGESEYQEINTNDVYLEVTYVADAAKAAALLKQPVKKEPTGLTVIKGSNCLNCHLLNTKLIGPSFHDICKRYPNTKPNIDKLIKHIKEGSTGVWGDVAMPSHPELTQQELQNIVQWMYKYGSQPTLNYYRGLEGSFRVNPPAANQKGAYILTASYSDHGTQDQPKQALRGQDAVLIYCGK